MASMRQNGRKSDELRPITITRNYLIHPEGSVLIEMGNTKVICTASVEESVPFHRKGTGFGWVTAEYGMLPRSTSTRMQRESTTNKSKGRTQEIQRLIGRSMRAITEMSKLGERTIYLDADVIQADGGTRTAAITGSFIALRDAVNKLLSDGKIKSDPLAGSIAAVSVGVVDGNVLLDLDYSEDSKAEVDMNVVMTDTKKFVEIQGTAESTPFSKEKNDEMLLLAQSGIKQLIGLQKEALK